MLFLLKNCLLQLQHPVLDSLKNTPRQWLIDLLYAFNSGDIAKMNELKQYWSSQVYFFVEMFDTVSSMHNKCSKTELCLIAKNN